MSAATEPAIQPIVAYPDTGPLVLFTHLARTTLFLESLQQECLAPFGLSFGDYMVIRVLRYAGAPHRLSPTRIGELVLRTSGGMTKIIDRLERAGLVRRRPDPQDKRGVLVTLTEAGQSRVDAALADLLAAEQALLAGLPETSRHTLAGLLRVLLAPLDAG